MTVYADTSWWIACKITDDANHDAAIRAFDLYPDIQVAWTPWQRAEVFNLLRQLERAGIVIAGKARELIRLLEQEVRLGYWPHAEFDWRDAVRTACELSAEHGLSVPIRGMDLFHVAIAIEAGADAFLTFDAEQEALADADLMARDKANLDIFWLKDDSLADTENLHKPAILAAEIVET